jgi:predicted MFS family arabinose efflux permease
MSRSAVISFVGLGAAALLATRLDGLVARGVLTGYALGIFVSLSAGLWLRHVIRTRPERALQGLLVGFGVKLAVMLIAALSLRFVDELGSRADWRSFLLAYAVAAILGLFSSTWENSRFLMSEEVVL